MIKERIIYLLESKKIAKEEFYAKIGMTSASFRGKAKNTPLNSSAIENIIAEIPDVNPYWLLTGEGEMLNSEKDSLSVDLLNRIFRLMDMIESQQRTIEALVKGVTE